jgi:drug/metabolite transporter (DMT)-like permease
MEHPTDRPLDASAVALMSLVCAIWGGAFVAIKIGLLDLPPLGSGALRFLLTALILFIWAWIKQTPLLYRGRELWVLLTLALFFFSDNLALYVGTAHTTSGRATVFFYSQPLFLALIAPVFLPQERLTVRKGWGLALACSGLILLFLTKMRVGHAPTLLGDTLVLGGALATAIQNLIMKRSAGKIHPVALILWSSLIAGVLLLMCSWEFERDVFFVFSGRAIASLLYLSLISAAFGFVAFVWLIQKYSATRVTTFVFLAPVLGVVFSWLLLQEVLAPTQILGVASVCIGVYLVSSNGTPRRRLAATEVAPVVMTTALPSK